MKATVPVLGALLLVAGSASGQPYYRTAVSKVPILPAPDMCNSGFVMTWPDGSFFYPCHNVYPPFEPFNGILPDKNGKFNDKGGNPYGYYHYPFGGQMGGQGYGPGMGGQGYGPGMGGQGYGPGMGGQGPAYGQGPGFGPGGPYAMPGFPPRFMPDQHLPKPGYMMGPGLAPPPPGYTGGLPPPGFSPGLPAPGYAPSLPAPGYPGYAPPPVNLPTPGYEPAPGAPKPATFPVHPFARSPRDFFMWSDVLEDRLVRSQRPSLVP